MVPTHFDSILLLLWCSVFCFFTFHFFLWTIVQLIDTIVLLLLRASFKVLAHWLARKRPKRSSTQAAVTVSGVDTSKFAFNVLEDLDCIICRDTLDDLCTLVPCLHTFCASCIHGWDSSRLSLRRLCPICQSTIDEKKSGYRIKCWLEKLERAGWKRYDEAG